jgi:peptidoglycan hydrolase-like protein with peptidoglycan-binding domain
MKLKDVGPQVRTLQKTLKKLGYLDETDTAIFWEHTQEALARFQQDSKVIEERGIWFFWDKTKNKLVELLANK